MKRTQAEREVEEIFGDVLDSIITGDANITRHWQQIFTQRVYLLSKCRTHQDMQRVAQTIFNDYYGE